MIDISSLNGPQQEAVLHTNGPLLILAGAGSGKTRVLTYRIAHLVKDEGVRPWNILAITFTNKAAGEMKERVHNIVGEGSDEIWVSTFHSACVRMLRRYIDRQGTFDSHFSIYDTDDAKSVIKAILKEKNINPRDLKENAVYNVISGSKNKGITPIMYQEQARGPIERTIGEIYGEYQKRLAVNNALDFDDILLKMVELLERDPEVRGYYQDRFRYIHVDEYQDTNMVQFRLIQLLTGPKQNLCVVGDDDQSIYRFRGADITNILSFEKSFPGARVVRLEQNYRSTRNILDAANGVIKNNVGRKKKTLWSDKGDGERIRLRQTDNTYEEAELVTDDIRRRVRDSKGSYKDFAVLYRTNAQSRALEERFVLKGIPYKIVGGINFYSRKEVKDILAYLKTIDNGVDDLAVRRIINVPKRGIGPTTLGKIQDYADSMGISFYEALRDSSSIPGLGKTADKLAGFVLMIESLKAKAEFSPLDEYVGEVIKTIGYQKYLEDIGDEDAKDRMENVWELVSKAESYLDKNQDEATLGGFLEEVALVADIDETDMSIDRVVLMTLHGAKGLEFPHVFITGVEDGVFPSYMSISSGEMEDMEEERRLAYVGITRAMDDLTLTCARSRMINGETRYNSISRFIKEIPEELLDPEGQAIVKRLKGDSISYGSVSYGGSTGFSKPKARLKSPSPGDEQPYIAKKLMASEALKKGSALAMGKPDYEVGDRVRHVKFGEGVVLELEETPRDYRVKVDFDGCGQKTMYAAFAKLEKV